MNIYHYPASSKLEIADGSSITTIDLPKSLDPADIAWAIRSEVLKTIISQLLTKGENAK